VPLASLNFVGQARPSATLNPVNHRPIVKVALFLGLSALTVVGYLFLLNVLNGKVGPFSAAVPAIFLALAAFALNWRFFKVEGRSLAEVGFDRPLLRFRQMAIGFVAGAFTVGGWIVALRWINPVLWQVASAIHASAAVASFAFIVFNNLAEELVYRSYLFLLLMRSYGTTLAIISTSVLFTLLHIQAGVPWPNALAGVLTSALLYAALFVRWRSVPLVLAFHAGMNVMQEAAGLRTSGLTIFVPEYAVRATFAQSTAVLVLAAAINLSLAAAVLFFARNSAGRTRRATGSGAG
jgi:membrane protease YdiL (CAAX protease family)